MKIWQKLLIWVFLVPVMGVLLPVLFNDSWAGMVSVVVVFLAWAWLGYTWFFKPFFDNEEL